MTDFFQTQAGLDIDSNAPNGLRDDAPLRHNFSQNNVIVGFGRSTTTRATRKLISHSYTEKFKTKLDKFKEKNPNATEAEYKKFIIERIMPEKQAVEFGKETLLQILSQEDCIGIRFAFCMAPEKDTAGNFIFKESILALGIKNESGKSVPVKNERFKKNDPPLDNDPIVKEKGNGKCYTDYVSEMGIPQDDFAKEVYDAWKENKLTDDAKPIKQLLKNFFAM